MTTAHRGDLVVIQSSRRVDNPNTIASTRSEYRLAVVTSITRDQQVKALREITGHDVVDGTTTPIPATRLPGGSRLIVLPAVHLRVADALAAILAHRADPAVGHLDPYRHAVDLLRDLHPWITGSDCLSQVRHLAYQDVLNDDDQRCGACGVTTYGRATIVIGDDGCPNARCMPFCPTGVNFTTDYPVGLDVMITAGFAEGARSRVERVSDAYPEGFDGIRYYAGRSYSVLLPVWGYRLFAEEFVRPWDDSLTDRYAVRRDPAAG